MTGVVEIFRCLCDVCNTKVQLWFFLGQQSKFTEYGFSIPAQSALKKHIPWRQRRLIHFFSCSPYVPPSFCLSKPSLDPGKPRLSPPLCVPRNFHDWLPAQQIPIFSSLPGYPFQEWFLHGAYALVNRRHPGSWLYCVKRQGIRLKHLSTMI